MSKNKQVVNDGKTESGVFAPPIIPGQVPIGSIIMYAGVSSSDDWLAQQGWMICNGRAMDMDQYKDLFSAIRGGYGQAGNTFNIPDCRGLFVRGVDSGAGNDPDAANRTAQHAGGNTGDKVGSCQKDELRSHQHDYKQYVPTDFRISHSGSDWTPPNNNVTSNTVNSGGKETRPVNVYAYYIIKYKNINP